MTPVLPQEIPKHWGLVEPGLKKIIEKTGEKWSPSHVLQALYEQRAFLFVEDEGFAVLQPSREDWTAEPYMNVWCFWFAPNRARDRWREFFAWLDERAAPFTWKFGSPLEGWGCKTLRDEIEVERVIYRRKR